MQLTLEQNAIGHAVAVMLEFNTAVAGFTWRYGYHMKEFSEKVKCEVACSNGIQLLL